MTRRTRTVLTVLSLFAALGSAGCGVRPSGVIAGLEAPSGPSQNTELLLYLLSDGAVVPVRRTMDTTSDTDLVAVLAAGPVRGRARAASARRCPRQRRPRSSS